MKSVSGHFQSSRVCKCMEELILKSLPTYPPRPHGPTSAMHNEYIQSFNGNNVEPFWTHGSQLRYAHPVDIDHVELMHLVTRCLADRPADRPSLDELAHWAAWSETRPGYNEEDDWFFDVFCSPDNVRRYGSPSSIFFFFLFQRNRATVANEMMPLPVLAAADCTWPAYGHDRRWSWTRT